MANKVHLIGDGDLKVTLNNLEKKMLTRELMKRLSLQAITEVFENSVEKGQDKFGKSFRPYSRNYVKIKKKRGGRFFSGHVNLFDKGHMMGNLTNVVQSSSQAFLHFPKIKERLKAAGHIKGSRTLPKRDFLGLTKKGEKALLSIVDDNLGDLTSG